MSAKPQESISRWGVNWEKGYLYRTIMLENVSVDVVEGARVKGVCWGCPSVPGGRLAKGVKA